MNTRIEEITHALRHSSMTSRRRAELELELYTLTPKVIRRDCFSRFGRRDQVSVLQCVYGITGPIQARRRLHEAGEVAEPLWRLIDEQTIAVHTVARLLKEARQRQTAKGTTLTIEIDQGIEAWLHRTTVVQTLGKIHRRRHTSVPSAKGAFFTIREAAAIYVDAYCKQVDHAIAKRIAADFAADVDALLTGLVMRIRREQKRAADSQENESRSTLRTVRDACAVLMIPPPRTHKHPVNIVEARTRYKALVRQYHPDVTGTSATRGLFEQVVAAFKELEAHNEANNEEARDGTEG